jgi:5'-methylthioadenosine phosphorylase
MQCTVLADGNIGIGGAPARLLRRAAQLSTRDGWTVAEVGTLPGASRDRAESRWYAAAHGTIVNMTGASDVAWAREFALCCATIAVVTDHDAGVEGEHGMTQEEVFKVFEDGCPSALDGMTLPFPVS